MFVCLFVSNKRQLRIIRSGLFFVVTHTTQKKDYRTTKLNNFARGKVSTIIIKKLGRIK